jgi:O-antigen/teichoic acid export membrane protein
MYGRKNATKKKLKKAAKQIEQGPKRACEMIKNRLLPDWTRSGTTPGYLDLVYQTVRQKTMTRAVEKILEKPAGTRLRYWGKLISITVSAQVIVQATGFIGGILVIRTLPTEQYALYTLANTMLGTMTMLADSGISAGVMAQGGKNWQDQQKMGIVLATGLDLRNKFALASLLFSAPVLLYLLRHHQASWLESLFIILAIVPAFFSSLSSTLLQIPAKLHQQITVLQRNTVEVNAARLVLLVSTLFVAPLAIVAVLSSGLPQIWANVRLKKISAGYADWNQKPDKAVMKEIISFVKRILPGVVYYCISGQIMIWLVSIFGTTASLAQIGALGRLTMLLTLLSVLFATLITPRFARLEENKKLLQSTFALIIGGLLAIVILIIGLVALFPSEVLWILGQDYSGLQYELVLSMSASCLALIAGSVFSLSTSRGWVVNPVFSVPINILSVILGVMLFKISTLEGILIFNIFLAAVQAVMHSLYCFFKMRTLADDNSLYV